MSNRTCCLDGFYDNGDMVVPCGRCHGKTVASIDLKILAIKTISEMHARIDQLETEVDRLRALAIEACNVGREIGLHYGERGRLDDIRKEAAGE